MTRLTTLAIAVLTALSVPMVAHAAPGVRVVSATCSTASPPQRAVVTRLANARGRLRVRIIGRGHLCAAGWTATHSGLTLTLTLTADASVDAPACPATCDTTLAVRDAPTNSRVLVVE